MTSDAVLDGAATDAPEVADGDAAVTETETGDEGTDAVEKPKTDPVMDELRAQLKRENRRIGKLTGERYRQQAELEQLRTRLSQYEQKNPAQNGDGPKEEDFVGKPYGEFLRAVARHEANESHKQRTQETQKQSEALESRQWQEERAAHAATNADKAIAAFPDYKQLYQDHADLLQSLPPQIEHVLLEADNPSFAFYAMCKDGSIEQLAGMTPTRAAAVIALAEQRALAMKKQVTNAPKPIAGAKGTATGSKSPLSMSDDELRAWMKS